MKSFHFSLRTVLILVAAFSVYLASIAAFTPHQGKIPVILLLTYTAFWLAPAVSLGYDRHRSWLGAINGFFWGAGLCAASFWLFGFTLLRSYSVYS